MKNLLQTDYKAVFEKIPGLYFILSTDFIIMDASHDMVLASMARREDIVGKYLFDAFPDNPEDKDANGVKNLTKSLNFVLRNKIPHSMAIQKYDVRKPNGEFEVRYWSPQNRPVLDADNQVLYIIHRVEDVTDFIKLQDEKHQTDIITDELRAHVKQMEIEIIKRSREIQKMNNELDQKVTERTNHLHDANETIRKNVEVLTSQKNNSKISATLSPTTCVRRLSIFRCSSI